ncbi:MAG: aminotransferase class I/II-fold pyridoxal phosphate-dependent enzyme [Gemmatimonadaceae bacterium]|nr:aminotransferase class I/II-fold pyridoxal phosphate-dependent enzyme [Gemmatimonadaceae bacterium]MCW5826181.1 aminotransferase class I/II-fold pyridoxal phosphate-dependent enzyme [Gemmatimonadaceae bacterium]
MPRPETLAIRTQHPTSASREHSVPLYLTSSFVFDDAEQARALFAEEREGPVYSRYSNPNSDEFVRKLVLLEAADDGIATASGMSAVYTAIASMVSAGDHIVAGRALFGSTHQLLTRVFPRWGVSHTYVDGGEAAVFTSALRPNTKLIFVETPSNPGLDLVDLAGLGALAQARGIPLVVDNSFSTPVLQRPLEYGASLVVHSATKFVDGQGRTLGGAVVGAKHLVAEARFLARHSGPALSPFNAWVLSKSLETLALRMERHSANALQLARWLETHPAVRRVRYPHLPSHPQFGLATRQMRWGGGVLTLEVANYDEARQLIDGLRLCSHSPNLGDVRTIVTHPASTTHSKLTEQERQSVGITPGLVRISVGLEHPDDVIADLATALRGVSLAGARQPRASAHRPPQAPRS